MLVSEGAARALFVSTRRRSRSERLQVEDVVVHRVGGERRVEEHQRPGGLDHPAHQVKPIADHRTRGAVTRHRHRGQRAPRIRQRVVRLDGSKRADELLGGDFTAGHVDNAAVGARDASAASGGHPLLGSIPRVREGVVLLDHIRVRGGQDEALAGASADDVNLAVDRGGERVIARHRHRLAGLPLVRGRVVHFVDAENPGGSEGGEERVL